MGFQNKIDLAAKIEHELLAETLKKIEKNEGDLKNAKVLHYQNFVSLIICNGPTYVIETIKGSYFSIGVMALDLVKREDYIPLYYNNNGIKAYCFTLMSDNELLIEKLAHVGNDLDIPRRNKGSLNLMLQCAMRDDIQALTEAMAVYEKYAVKKRWDELQLEFYRTYIDRDEERVKDVLTELETPKLRRQSIFYREFIDDYLSILTAAYLKMCWRNGMEIQIDSPTVPMAMMPVEPLETYEVAYPYLEGWESEEWETAEPKKEEKVYEAVGPYPSRNPSLRSKFVSQETVRKVVDHFCPKHTVKDKERLCDFIWEAYTNPKQFDLTHEQYVRKHASFPVTNKQGTQVLEAMPFWSELTEYDDEGYFRYCNHFIIMNEMNIEHDKVETMLDSIKTDLDNKGGFLKKLFS